VTPESRVAGVRRYAGTKARRRQVPPVPHVLGHAAYAASLAASAFERALKTKRRADVEKALRQLDEARWLVAHVLSRWS